jgi:hypothetical protein
MAEETMKPNAKVELLFFATPRSEQRYFHHFP